MDRPYAKSVQRAAGNRPAGGLTRSDDGTTVATGAEAMIAMFAGAGAVG